MGSVGSSTKSFLSWRKKVKTNYGVLLDYDLDDDYSTMQDISISQRSLMERELRKFVEVFPELKQMHVTISFEDTVEGHDDSWVAAYDGSMSHIIITPSMFDNNAYQQTVEPHWYAGVFTSFHPQGTQSISSLSHELGHALLDNIARIAISNSGNYSSYSSYLDDFYAKRRDLANEITDSASKNLNNSHNNLVGKISHYASTDRLETVAEAVCDYIANKNKANPYSRAIVKELKGRLKQTYG